MAKTFESQLHSVNHFVLHRFSSQDTETKKNIDMVSRSAPRRTSSSWPDSSVAGRHDIVWRHWVCGSWFVFRKTKETP